MPIGPAVEIQPTFEDQYQGPVGGALLSTVIPDNPADDRWINGFGYLPTSNCGPGSAWAPCADDTWPDPETNVAPVQVTAFEAVAGYRCDSRGLTWAERLSRARRSLDRYAGAQLELELWKGTKSILTFTSMIGGNVDPVLSPFLANAATLTDLSPSDTSPLMYALASLQEALREGIGDAIPGVIHATAKTVSLWQQGGALKVDPEGRIRDLFGNYIIAGSGYDGSAPVTVDPDDGTTTGGAIDSTGRTAWAYATGPVGVRLGAVRVLPDDVVEAMDRPVNDITAYAAQPAAVWFTPCGHYAINVDLCNTACS